MVNYKKDGYFNFKDKKEGKKHQGQIKDFKINTKDYKEEKFKAYKKKRLRARIVKYEIKD